MLLGNKENSKYLKVIHATILVGVANSIIGGGAHIYILVFTAHQNNRF